MPLYHRIYTHMPDAAGVPGGRVYRLGELDAEAVLSEAQRRRLDHLLESLVPPANGQVWAICRFAGAQHDYSCLVVSRTAHDAEGRTGVLTHARLAQVEAGGAMLDLPALMEVARTASDAGDLDAFARRLGETEPNIAVAPWSAVDVQTYDRDDASAVLSALLAGIPRPDDTFHASLPATDDRLHLLVNVWALLPIVFQRALSCALDAQAGARVTVAFAAADAKVPGAVRKLARRWVDWVYDRPDDARRLIETISGPGLTEFERELNAAQEPPMTKTKSRPAEPRPQQQQRQGGPLDEKLVEFLNEQIETSQESIYEWLERELRRHDITAKAPRAFHRGAAARELPSSAVMAVGAIALVALVAAGWMWFRASRAERRIAALEQKVLALSEGTGVPLPATQPADTVTPASEDAARDPLREPETIAGVNWPERFQWVVDNRQRELAPDIVRLAQTAPAARLPVAKQRELQRMVDVLQANGALTAADRRLLRAFLFELIAAEGVAANRTLAIDGAPADVPASAVTRVKEELRIATQSSDPASADLQSEVVLRWLAQQR
ncbi:MAG TPA: hypothetical protein VNI54_02950 [Thermoanaerobaculia bacterium]|nr:hypothetical protein [Thermoanaerobaculia bacterium]